MKYLMWNNTVIGEIGKDCSVKIFPENIPAGVLVDKTPYWSPEQFRSFLNDRIISRERRDIEKLLFRCGLSVYDTFKIADRTKAINAKDLFRVSDTGTDKFQDVITDVFDSVFNKNVDLTGDSVNTPEGCNVKRYGVYNGRYGIYKKRLAPVSKDVESEVAVYQLGAKIGVPCCRAIQTDENTVFSEFQYNFSSEQIVHFRRFFETKPCSENQLQSLVEIRPQYKTDFYKMVLLDFITGQDDRHLSNIAIKVNTATGAESFYPLYDNGRSLFYQDTVEIMKKAAAAPATYSTGFGAVGSYWDYVCDIMAEDGSNKNLINLSIGVNDIYNILKNSGFKDEHLELTTRFISNAIFETRTLDIEKIRAEKKGVQLEPLNRKSH